MHPNSLETRRIQAHVVTGVFEFAARLADHNQSRMGTWGVTPDGPPRGVSPSPWPPVLAERTILPRLEGAADRPAHGGPPRRSSCRRGRMVDPDLYPDEVAPSTSDVASRTGCSTGVVRWLRRRGPIPTVRCRQHLLRAIDVERVVWEDKWWLFGPAFRSTVDPAP